MENISIELKAAETLLDIGVKLKVKAPMFLRLFGKKTINLTIKQPYLGTSLRASSLYLKAQENGIHADNMTEALVVRKRNSKLIAKAVAVYILRGRLASCLFASPLAIWLINGVAEKTLLNIMNVSVTSGIEDFMSTIRLTAQMKMTAPNLSPMERRS